jgi:serine/threonine protein kinase
MSNPSPSVPEQKGDLTLSSPSGPPVDWVTPPTPGEVITSEMTGNTYTMGDKIGEGHFGLVYGCVDGWNNSLAAKVMKPLGPYEKVKESTVAELSKLSLLRHPYVTYVYDAFEYRETFYIITERCHSTVSELFEIPSFSGLIWIKPIARCLLQAVHFLHTNGYVHQDIHAGNVLTAFAKDEMGPNEGGAIQFKLGDLGVAKLFSEIDVTNTRALWMLPPEVFEPNEFGPIDHRIDIYHCGLLFLFLVNGREIYFTRDAIITGKPRALALQLAPPLNFALEKALRRHVQFRTASAMELWRDLNSPEPNKAPALESMSFDFDGPKA